MQNQTQSAGAVTIADLLNVLAQTQAGTIPVDNKGTLGFYTNGANSYHIHYRSPSQDWQRDIKI